MEANAGGLGKFRRVQGGQGQWFGGISANLGEFGGGQASLRRFGHWHGSTGSCKTAHGEPNAGEASAYSCHGSQSWERRLHVVLVLWELIEGGGSRRIAGGHAVPSWHRHRT
eukprot:814231-Prorocentrum_minimum.AAC.1